MRFLVVKHTTEEGYIVLSRKVSSAVIHWVCRRSVPCVRTYDDFGRPVEDGKVCPNCNPETPRRWQGYLHVMNKTGSIEYFLCLPPGAGWELLTNLPPDYDLRGKRLYARREGTAQTCPLLLRLDPNYTASCDLPIERDPGKFLDGLFAKVRHLTQQPA
jgi:hypothetical protein